MKILVLSRRLANIGKIGPKNDKMHHLGPSEPCLALERADLAKFWLLGADFYLLGDLLAKSEILSFKPQVGQFC